MVSGNWMLVNAVRVNAYEPIDRIPSGKLMESIGVFANALCPMCLTVSCNKIFFNLGQPSNNFSGMVSIPIITVPSSAQLSAIVPPEPRPLKLFQPTLVTELGMVIVLTPESANVPSAISFIESGIITESRFGVC